MASCYFASTVSIGAYISVTPLLSQLNKDFKSRKIKIQPEVWLTVVYWSMDCQERF